MAGALMVEKVSTLTAADAERFRAYERQRHDALAVTYHNFFTPVTMLAHAPLLDAVQLEPRCELLDVATGPGSLAAAATTRGVHAVGVDLSSGMVALAAQLHPDTEFRVADVEHLPFADGIFDALVCNFAIGHFPYPEAAVAECVRVLKRGGRMALSWWDDPSRQRIQGLFREAINEIGVSAPPDIPTGYSLLRFSDSAALVNLLHGAGAAGVQIDEHATTHTVPDIETLWRGGLGSFAVTASAIAHQDMPTQAAIRAALERRAAHYQTISGYILPIAFKVAHGRAPL
jgi:SAM-dependent methyltransferase